jgi:hypothetical protein
MIAADRPVNGGDLKALRSRLGLDLREFCAVMGIGVFVYHGLTKDSVLGTPLRDAALALLVRWYDNNPDDVPRLHTPSFGEIKNALMDAGIKISEWHLVTLLGRNFTSFYRYRHSKDGNSMARNANGIAKASFSAFERMLQKHGKAGFKKWLAIVNLEAHARGAKSDIVDLKAGHSVIWPQPNVLGKGRIKRTPKASAKKAVAKNSQSKGVNDTPAKKARKKAQEADA